MGRKKPGRVSSNKPPADGKPFKKRASTYFQGTLLKLYDYHIELTGESEANYLRALAREDLTKRYDIHPTIGIVRLTKRS